MTKFLFKSRDQDLSKTLSINKLDLINKNILYVTHQTDKILEIVRSLQIDKHLQKQVDEYMQDREPEDDKEPD